MSMIAHTLLFFIREQNIAEDFSLLGSCLCSLEKGGRRPVIVYNQGFLANEQVAEFLGRYQLDFHLIGTGKNDGTAAGRQACFEYIWNNLPDTDYITEIHPDMIFTPRWADILADYLDRTDEPMISSGIINRTGVIPFADRTASFPNGMVSAEFLEGLCEDRIVLGFNNPCMHRSQALRLAGGYDTRFLTGKSCYEDDSMLLSYFYYCGIRSGWRPKVNLNAMVYHATATQWVGLGHDQRENYNGLVRQYGAMGLKHLSELHESVWHKQFFFSRYQEMLKSNSPASQ